MKGGMKMVVAIVTGLATMMVMVEPGQAVDCPHLESLLAPCVQYLTGGSNDPSTACCDGINTAKSETPTPADRRAACECLKNAASHFSGIIEDRAASLPKRCGVDLGVPISKDIKCSDIN